MTASQQRPRKGLDMPPPVGASASAEAAPSADSAAPAAEPAPSAKGPSPEMAEILAAAAKIQAAAEAPLSAEERAELMELRAALAQREAEAPQRPHADTAGIDADEEEWPDVRHGRRPLHGTRHQEMAGSDTVHETADQPWLQPANLDAPPPLPGMKQRWIRIEMGGKDDPKNISRKLREGWTPRDASTVPAGWESSTKSYGRFGNVISAEGLVLCHMPIARVRQRNAFYAQRTADSTRAIDEHLNKVERPGIPIHRDRQSGVTTGRRPRVMPDHGLRGEG